MELEQLKSHNTILSRSSHQLGEQERSTRDDDQTLSRLGKKPVLKVR